MRLYHNMMSMNLYSNYLKNLVNQSKSIRNLSSGTKLNSAKENPNTLGQSEQLRIQIRGLQAAQKNLQDGASMIQTVDSSLDSITQAIQRIKELITQSGSGVMASEDKKAIQSEIDQLKNHIDLTSQNTEFNGVRLISNSNVTTNNNPEILNMTSGANVGDNIEIPMYKVSSNTLGIDNIDVLDASKLGNNLSKIYEALKNVSSIRSAYGALQQRFESLIENSSGTEGMLEKADSNLRDADIANEMLEYSKSNILIEAGTALMAQSNRFPQDVLRILERLK